MWRKEYFTLVTLLMALPPFASRADDPLPEGAIMRLGDMRWRFAEHSTEAKRYAWLPDSSGIVACGRETIRLLDAKTGRVIRDWKGDRGDSFMSVAVSPDGKTLAATKVWGLVYLWDIATGTKLKVLAPGGGAKKEHYVDHIAFSPDGKRLVTGRYAVQLWDVESGKLLRVWQPRTDVDAVGFRPDGKTVFAVAGEYVTHWKENSDKSSNDDRLVNEFLPVAGLPRCASPAGDIAVRQDQNNIVTIRNGTSGYELGKLERILFQRFATMNFSPDGKHLWTATFDNRNTDVAIWQIPSGKLVRELKLPTFFGVPLASPDGRKLAVLNGFACLRLFDTLTGKSLLQLGDGHDQPPENAVFSTDGNTLLSYAGIQSYLWNNSTGLTIKRPEDRRQILALTAAPRQQAFVVGGLSSIRMLDERTGEEIREYSLAGVAGFVTGLHVSKKGDVIAATLSSDHRRGDVTNSFGRWNLGNGRRLQASRSPYLAQTRFAEDGRSRVCVLFSEDRFPGNREDQWAFLAIHETFGDLQRLNRRLAGNRELSFSVAPDGNTVVTASTHETWTGDSFRREGSYLQVWDLVTGEERLRIKRLATGAFDYFGEPLFSPNGRVIVAPWAQRTLLFFDALTGRELGQFKHDIGLNPLAFTADGKRLATGVADGTILIWEVGKFTWQTKTRHLSLVEIEMSWRDLASEIRPAVEAMARLEESPAQALALFRERMKPAEPIPAIRLQALIADLQNPAYAKREAASRELLRLDEQAHPALRAALSVGPEAESRKRIQSLLAEPALVRSPEIRRRLRAIELTGAIGTPEAKALLAEWAKGDPAARETQAAKTAVQE